MQAEPLITWPKPLEELIGFVALFLADGAIGFRFAAIRGGLRDARATTGQDETRLVHDDAARRAALLGV